MADIVLTEHAWERLRRVVYWAEQQIGRSRSAGAGPRGEAKEVQLVRITSGTSDGNGHYPGVPTEWDEDAGEWVDYDAVLVKPSDGEVLTSGERYPAHPVGEAPGGEPLYLTLGQSAGSAGTITVEEVDGSPSYTSTGTVRFDQADGFVVTQPASGIARVDMQAATTLQAGIVSTSGQTFGGRKVFDDGLDTKNTLEFTRHTNHVVYTGPVSAFTMPNSHAATIYDGATAAAATTLLGTTSRGSWSFSALNVSHSPQQVIEFPHSVATTEWRVGAMYDTYYWYQFTRTTTGASDDGTCSLALRSTYDEEQSIYLQCVRGTGSNVVVDGNAGASATTGGLTFVGGIYTGGTLSGGTGDVVGPSSSVAGEIALFDLTTGKLLKRATGTGGVEATSGVYSTYTLTTAGKALLDDATASDQRTTLGLGTISTQNASAVSITGGSITGITDLAVADGGTGASTAGGARTNLGLVIGTDVQAWDADLDALAGVSSGADQLPYFTASHTASVTTLTSFGRTLIDDADASTARTTLGLVIGTNVQAYDAELAAIAGLTSAADKLPYFTGSGTAALADFSSFARTLIDDASAAAARTTLGVTPAHSVCGGRLSLVTGESASLTDTGAVTTLYYVPHTHGQIGLYDGSAWALYTFTEKSLALSSLTANKNYDVFLYDNSGTLTLELSAAWTTDTARADALATQDGVIVKSGAATRRWLGTIRTVNTNASRDDAAYRFVWNAYNRVPRLLKLYESTSSWSYATTNWRYWNNNSSNRLEFVVGDAQSTLFVQSMLSNAGTTANSFGLDANTPTAPQGVFGWTPASWNAMASASYATQPTLGYHYLALLEWVGASTTIYGLQTTAGDNYMQSGVHGWIMA